jgi:hypothetical protein
MSRSRRQLCALDPRRQRARLEVITASGIFADNVIMDGAYATFITTLKIHLILRPVGRRPIRCAARRRRKISIERHPSGPKGPELQPPGSVSTRLVLLARPGDQR